MGVGSASLTPCCSGVNCVYHFLGSQSFKMVEERLRYLFNVINICNKIGYFNHIKVYKPDDVTHFHKLVQPSPPSISSIFS